MITYYHGTSPRHAETVIDSPELRMATNGLGFYMTRDLSVAQSYGSVVIAFEIDIEHTDNIIVRPISDTDRRLEHVLTNQKDLINFIVNLDDAYTL